MDKITHLFNRAAFGYSDHWKRSSVEQCRKELFQQSAKATPLDIIENPIEEFQGMAGVEERRKKIFQRSKEDTLRLNAAWVRRFSSPSEILREKMTLFWHDHFACRVLIPYLAQQQNNTIRKYALGSFRDLLMAVSKDPAMLQFLNNQQNKKDSPNENFAREVMELFTLGRGQYTEQDIKNAARSFTGWAFSPSNGQFIFRKRVHDEGMKTFRGRSGNLSGEDILNQVLDDQQTARFITKKVWKYFISDSTENKEVIESLSQSFFRSGYDIEKLMKEIYSSDWFYDDRFRGNRIKSPVELIAGIQVHTGGSFAGDRPLLFIEKALGQVLFVPPNVGGWPSGEEWIDSSSLTFRMTLPAVLFQQKESDVDVKDDGDVNNILNTVKKAPITLAVSWNLLAEKFVKGTREETFSAVEGHLMARAVSVPNRKIISSRAGDTTTPDGMRKLFSLFMSLPEYQLS